MPPTVNANFKSWLKSNVNMKLSSDAAVTRITYEGITNYDSLVDFDKKSIESLPSTCKEKIPAITEDVPNGVTAEVEISGANVSSISVRRLIVASNAAKYFTSVGRAMTPINMHYTKVLSNFKIEWEAYLELKSEDPPTPPSISDKDADRKVIKWAPIFQDCLSRTYGSRGPLIYVLREESKVPTEVEDPLDGDDYFGKSGCLHDELEARLPHKGPIYKHDNTSVFLLIEKAARNTSVESTVKAFARTKDGRGAYQAIVTNHAGVTKYRAIHKKRMTHLQTIQWNGRSIPLEKHVSSHRQAIDDIKECAEHITVAVPDQAQRVEYLLDSISCSDNTLQASLGLIRANTNGMRKDFELASSTLIEVDPYQRSNNRTPSKRGATVSSIDFNAGRGTSGVDLRWHHPKEFRALSNDQKDELCTWQKTQEGKRILDQSRTAAAKKQKEETKSGGKKKDPKAGTTVAWKKKLKQAIKTQDGFKTIMSVLAAEEKCNKAMIKALIPAAAATASASAATVVIDPPPASDIDKAFPATSLKLNTILKRGGKN